MGIDSSVYKILYVAAVFQILLQVLYAPQNKWIEFIWQNCQIFQLAMQHRRCPNGEAVWRLTFNALR